MTAPKFAAARGRQPTIEYVPIAELLIDDGYQRSIDTLASEKLIDRIAARWDWDVFDVLKVSRRPDDRLFVIDGQHRLTAARRRGGAATSSSCRACSSGAQVRRKKHGCSLSRTAGARR